jgi:hypothetical protein
MQSNRENVRELLSLEASLSDCRRSIAERSEKKDSLTALLSAYDSISEYKKLTDADDTRADMMRIRSELDSLRSTPADHVTTARLRELTEIMDRCGDTASELAQRRCTVENELASIDAPLSSDDPARVENEGAALRRSSLSMTAAGAAVAVVAVIASAVLFISDLVSVATAGVILAAGVAAAVALIAAAVSRRSALKALLSGWGAENIGELRDCAAARIKDSDRAKELEAELRYTDLAATENENTRQETSAEIVSLAGKLGLDAESVPDEYYGDAEYSFDDNTAHPVRSPLACLAEYAADVSDDVCRRRDALLSEYNTVSGRLSVLEEHFEGVDRAAVLAAGKAAEQSVDGTAAMALDPDGAAEAKRERDFCADTLNALKSRESMISEKLAALRAVTGSAAEDEEKINRLSGEIERLTLRHDALCLARDTLIRAGEGLRRGVMPQIVTTAAEYLRAASKGRYGDIGVAHDLSVSFTDDSVSRSIEYLSEGTKEMTYICLRMALSEVMFGDRRPPAIYDESFAGLDEARLKEMMRLIASHGQSILFTCRRLEASIAEEMEDGAGFNRITLAPRASE